MRGDGGTTERKVKEKSVHYERFHSTPIWTLKSIGEMSEAWKIRHFASEPEGLFITKYK